MVNYSHIFEFPYPYYRTHEMNGNIALAPYGFVHRKSLPDMRSLDLLPPNFTPRRGPPPQNMLGRNPGLYINTHKAQQWYRDGVFEDSTSYYANY